MSSNIFGYSGASAGGFNLSAALQNYVTLSTGQLITGRKEFSADLTSSNLEVKGELTIEDPVNLDTCTILQNNNNTQIISHTVSGTLETFQTDATATECRTLQLSTLATSIYNRTVNIKPNDDPDETDTAFVLTARADVSQYNPRTIGLDCVISAVNVVGGSPVEPNLVLTTASATNTGIRVTPDSVEMGTGGSNYAPTTGIRVIPGTVVVGAGGTGASPFTPSTYISISTGLTPISVGPVPSSSDNSTKIATTAWTTSKIASAVVSRGYDLWNNTTVGSGTVYYILNIPTDSKQFGSMTVWLRTSFTNDMYVKFPNPGPYRGMEIVMRWTRDTQIGSSWGVASLNVTDAIFVANVSNSPEAIYTVGPNWHPFSTYYQAATWQCDGTYWHLISRV